MAQATFDTPGNYTWIAPVLGLTPYLAWIECWGGGAHGEAPGYNGAGGGAGAYAAREVVVTGGQGYSLTVGGPGEASSFTAQVVAPGASGSTGGAAGAATGHLRHSGGDGAQVTQFKPRGGDGGASPRGGTGGSGGNGLPEQNHDGSDGAAPGGGGGGAGFDGSTGFAAGNGASGCVRISYPGN